MHFVEKYALDKVVYAISFVSLECNNISPEMETDVVRETPAPAPPRIFKGMLACAVLYL